MPGKILSVEKLKARGTFDPNLHATRRESTGHTTRVAKLEPPKWLTPEQLKYWAIIHDDIAEQVDLAVIDATALGMLITKIVSWLDAARTLDEQGPQLVDRHGTIKMNPIVRVEKSLFDQCMVLFKQFGLTPYSRQSLEAVTDAASDYADWQV